MWCSECQADVTASPDAPSSCGRCGGRLRMAGDATIREARDIISRWSSSDMLDRISSLPPIPQLSSSAVQTPGLAQSAMKTANSGTALGRNSGASADSGQSSSGFSDQRQSERTFDDADAEEQSDGAFHTEDESVEDSNSILDDLDKLARRSNAEPGGDDRPSEAYLRLAEIERPKRQEASIDVTDLLLSQPFEQETEHRQSEGVTPEPQPTSTEETGQDRETDQVNLNEPSQQTVESGQVAMTEQDSGVEAKRQRRQQVAASKRSSLDAADAAQASAPSLSSLLKQSNSASVGQLAWMIEDQRLQRGKEDESLKQKAKIQETDDSTVAAESLQSESSSQLRSNSKQTKNQIDSERGAEFQKDPVNLSDSDQADQKVSAHDFSQTLSEEDDANQPILPVRVGDDDQSGTQPQSADSQRVAQPRKAQRRKQHPRNLKQAASVLDDDDQKGMNTVSRKYRVDNPNPESVEAAIASDQQQVPVANSHSNATGRRFRIDNAESMDGMLDTADSRVRTQGRSRQRYIDEPHGNAIRGPHFQVVGKKRSNVASMTGQFLAYLGVLGLTIGTAIVIYGHFGGMSEYTPTGWLVTTVAQMMLFLGVINLVSGGIEQNNDDVSVRINTLGEQLMRIEQVTEQALRGPKIAASRYADPDSATEETRTRETVEVNK